MKYWYDTEFLEDGNSIVPISIGVVAENNRELYLINKNYTDQLAQNPTAIYWNDYVSRNDFVRNVVDPYVVDDIDNQYSYDDWPELLIDFFSDSGKINHRMNNELWGYFGAYDHVVLAQTFGPMINLPHPIPMFTKEIMQLPGCGLRNPPYREEIEHHALADARYQRKLWEAWK